MLEASKKLRIGYVTTYNPTHSKKWEKDLWGFHSAGHCLASHLEKKGLNLVMNFGEVAPSRWHRNLKEKISNFSPFGKYYQFCDPQVLKEDAKLIESFLRKSQADILLSAQHCLFFGYPMSVQLPRVLYTDTPIAALMDYYPDFYRLSARTKNRILHWEKASFENAERILFYTEWALNAARKIYAVPEEKMEVLAAGPNLIKIPEYSKKTPKQKLVLGFIASRWMHKGGEFFIEIAQALKNSPLPFQIEAIGDIPEKFSHLIKSHGWIDKPSSAGEKKFIETVQNWDLLIHPTIADTFGHVICEANALGVPVLVSDLGCMKEMVENEVNGYRFNCQATAQDWSEKILSLAQNPKKLENLSQRSYETYLKKFSWDRVCLRLIEVLNAVSSKASYERKDFK